MADIATAWRQLEETRLLAAIEQKTAVKRFLEEKEAWMRQRDLEDARLAELKASTESLREATLAEIDTRMRAATDAISQRYAEFTSYRDTAIAQLKAAEDSIRLQQSSVSLERRRLDAEREVFARDRAALDKEREELKQERGRVLDALTRSALDAPAGGMDIYTLAGLVDGTSGSGDIRTEIAMLTEAKDVLEQEVVFLMEYKGGLQASVEQKPDVVEATPMSRMAATQRTGAGTHGEEKDAENTHSKVVVTGRGGGDSVALAEPDAASAAPSHSRPLPGPTFFPSVSQAAFNAIINSGNEASVSQEDAGRAIVPTVSTTHLMRATPSARAMRVGAASPVRSRSVDTAASRPPRHRMNTDGFSQASGSERPDPRWFGGPVSSHTHELPVLPTSNNSHALRGPAHDEASRTSASVGNQQRQPASGSGGWEQLSGVIDELPVPPSTTPRGRQYDRAVTSARALLRSARSWSPHEHIRDKVARSRSPGSDRGSIGSRGSLADVGDAMQALMRRVRACRTPVDMLNVCDLSAVGIVRIERRHVLVCHGSLDKVTRSGVRMFYFWLLTDALLYGYLSPSDACCNITRHVPLAG